MTRDEIAAEVVEVLSEVADVDPAGVAQDSSLVIDLELDSLLMVDVFVALETHFAVSLPKDELPRLRLVSDLVTHIDDRLAA